MSAQQMSSGVGESPPPAGTVKSGTPPLKERVEELSRQAMEFVDALEEARKRGAEFLERLKGFFSW